MSRYSIEGYLIALAERGKRTLLVEGRGDQRIVSRVINGFIEANLLPPDWIVIDSAELINGGGVVFSHREIVEYVYAAASNKGLEVIALVDREFREFQKVGGVRDVLGGHHAPEPNLFWTRGHSIENYFFSDEYVINFLRKQHPEHVFPPCYDAVRNAFPTIICWAAALSLSVEKLALIEKSAGLTTPDCWDFSRAPESAFDCELFATRLNARTPSAPIWPQFVSTMTADFRLLLSSSDPEIARWISHGHLGEEMIWSAVAQIGLHSRR